MKKLVLILAVIFFNLPSTKANNEVPQFSTVGFFKMENSGRDVFSMNPAWRFHKAHIDNNLQQTTGYDDLEWNVVSLPYSIEIVPVVTSGSKNYQGDVWYRKHFIPKKEIQDKQIFLHFEANMDTSKVYINGELVKVHFGGYLPVVIDLSTMLNSEQDNVVAACEDNSDDPIYPSRQTPKKTPASPTWVATIEMFS